MDISFLLVGRMRRGPSASNVCMNQTVVELQLNCLHRLSAHSKCYSVGAHNWQSCPILSVCDLSRERSGLAVCICVYIFLLFVCLFFCLFYLFLLLHILKHTVAYFVLLPISPNVSSLQALLWGYRTGDQLILFFDTASPHSPPLLFTIISILEKQRSNATLQYFPEFLSTLPFCSSHAHSYSTCFLFINIYFFVSVY